MAENEGGRANGRGNDGPSSTGGNHDGGSRGGGNGREGGYSGHNAAGRARAASGRSTGGAYAGGDRASRGGGGGGRSSVPDVSFNKTPQAAQRLAATMQKVGYADTAVSQAMASLNADYGTRARMVGPLDAMATNSITANLVGGFDTFAKIASPAYGIASSLADMGQRLNNGALTVGQAVKGLAQGALGKYGGLAGEVANIGIDAATGNPASAAGRVGRLAGGLVGSMIGGSIAGQAGAQWGGGIASGLLGGAMARGYRSGAPASGAVRSGGGNGGRGDDLLSGALAGRYMQPVPAAAGQQQPQPLRIPEFQPAQGMTVGPIAAGYGRPIN